MTTIEAKPNLYVRTWRGEKALYKWTWVKTRKLCKPQREDYRDQRRASKGYKPLSKTYNLRGGLGYLIWICLSVLGYLVPGQEVTSLWQILYVLAPYWMILPCIMAASVALYTITEPHAKRDTLRSLTVPLTRVLVLVPFASIWIAAIWLASSPEGNTLWGLENWNPIPHPSLLIDFLLRVAVITILIASPLLLVFFIWFPFATINLVYRLFGGNFRAIDGHPYLWPITAIASAWATVVFNAVVNGPSRSFSPNAHLLLRLTVSWGGPVILSAIAIAEMIWLWRYDIRPRDGSFPPPSRPEPKPVCERNPALARHADLGDNRGIKYLALIVAVLFLAGIGTWVDYQQPKVRPMHAVSGLRAWEGGICTLVKFSPPVVTVLMGLSKNSASSEMLRGVTVWFSNTAGGEEFSGTASFNHEFKPGDVYVARSRVTRLSTAEAKSPPPGANSNSVGWCDVQGVNAVP